MERDQIDLYTLQNSLKRGVESIFPGKFWVKAEISAIKSRAGGHCYLELSQSQDGRLIAKISAIIWASRFRLLSSYFEKVTSSPISEGMQVLVQVQVNYSELYGFSLIINDIDAEYTVGEKEINRQKTIERLVREGLMDRQKQLDLPGLPYRLAVISAANAAGFRDFMTHLHENEFGFVLHTALFEAVMQGKDCPASIAGAMQSVLEEEIPYDVILILRGGGAKLDLACFDEYDLAAAIARCPLPVFTAVGHDQDYHVCDMVAHTFVKTPTALADEFLDYYIAEDTQISSYGNRLRMAFSNKISRMSSQIDLLESKIRGADPRQILKRGYVLALDGNGIVRKSVDGLESGDKMRLMMADGILDCTINEVDR